MQRKPGMRNILYIHEYDVIHAGFKQRDMIKPQQNFVQGSFLIKSLKFCHKNKGDFLALGPL